MTQYNHNYITDIWLPKLGVIFGVYFLGVFFPLFEAPTPVSRSNDPIWVIVFVEYTLVKGLSGHVGISVPFEGVCGGGWMGSDGLVPPKCPSTWCVWRVISLAVWVKSFWFFHLPKVWDSETNFGVRQKTITPKTAIFCDFWTGVHFFSLEKGPIDLLKKK